MHAFIKKAWNFQTTSANGLRKKALRALGWFLALMAVLTLLSRAADSMTVARVSVSTPENKIIEHTVEGSGKVVQGQEQAVVLYSGIGIKTLYVNQGQSVKKGDLLLQLSLSDLEEQILSVRHDIEKLRLNNQDNASQKSTEKQKKDLAASRALEDQAAAAQKGNLAVSQASRNLENAQNQLNDFYARQSASTPAVIEDLEANGSGDEAGQAASLAAEETQLIGAVDQARDAYDNAVIARDEAQRTAQRALEDARLADPEDSTQKLNDLDIKLKEIDLEKLENLQAGKGKVTAPADGVVTKVDAVTGGKTTDAAAVTLADLSSGCIFTAQLPVDEEKYITRDSSVTLTPSGDGKPVEGLSIDSVVPNGEDTQLLDVTVKLPAGTLSMGTPADIRITQDSPVYPCSVPIQAIHEEDNRYFVLVLDEEDSVLGKTTIARRVEVRILDKNNLYAALDDNALSSQQEVITNSNKNISAGDRVRLEES